jgi:hypothetical protein
MEWKGRRQSDNVEDRRAEGPGPSGNDPFGRGGLNLPSGDRRIGLGSRGSIGSFVVFIIIILVLYAMGVDVTQLLDQGGQTNQPGIEQSDTGQTVQPAATDEMRAFVATILAETEDTWQGIFKAGGKAYEEPKLVLFSGSVASACGLASAATGPFYCPSDRKVYLDTAFFAEMARRFDASGDFAEAYVIAHEVGHHVQNLLGILPEFNRRRQAMSEVDANKLSVRVELQADCFAGIWGKFTEQKGILEKGDLEEALNAATQIGDDALQRRTQGYVVPDSFNHGTSQQRVRWFRKGFDSGKMSACDTFSGPV